MKTPFEQGDAGGFDEAKYKRLMERLEAVEINLSECQSVIDFRIDANTYKKAYLISDKLIKSKEHNLVETISTSVQNFGAYSLCNYINFTEKGIPFLMTENIRHNYIDWNLKKYVDRKSHEMLWKSHCSKGQVLVTMAGEYLGRVAVYDKDFICSSNQAIAKVTIRSSYNPYVISTFLNTKHGQNQINRFRTITGQPNINMALIKSLFIPEFGKTFSNKIEKLIKNSEAIKGKSQQAYHDAETLLLETLGLKDFKPSHEKVNVKTLKDSFLQSGRLDAEYYQVKYEEIVDIIQKQKHELLGNLVNIKKSIEPGSAYYDDKGIPFLRVADFSKYGISTPQKHLSSGFIKENTELVEGLKPKVKTILFSKDGSVGNALMLERNENLITSGAILHLTVHNEKVILPQYLTLVLNSLIVKMQAERDAGGSIILHWKPSEIEQVLIPILDLEIQKQISQKVTESFRLKKQSEQLLDMAKTAVEMAIEKSEEEAVAWMKGEMPKLNIKK